MTAYWEPGTQYDYGSVVEYDGHRYKIIQPHRSQSDWTPPVTPALWGRLDDDDNGGHWQGGSGEYPTEQKAEIQPEEHKKHWYDLDDKRKKELELGGGLLAGAAVLAGGYFAYKEHEKNEEEKKAITWSLQNWIREAKIRTAEYNERGALGPATWILNEGTNIPPEAIEVGQEHDWKLYICRAFHDGSLQVGKASNVFKKGAVIGYKHEEIHLGTYEILVGNIQGLRWVDASGRLDISSLLPHKPVEGGHEADGTPLYIAEAPYNGAVHPGKASKDLDGAYIPYDGTEKKVEYYRVLCYA